MTMYQAFLGRQNWEERRETATLKLEGMKKLNNIIKQDWFTYFFLIHYNYYNIILHNSGVPKSAEAFIFFSVHYREHLPQ